MASYVTGGLVALRTLPGLLLYRGKDSDTTILEEESLSVETFRDCEGRSLSPGGAQLECLLVRRLVVRPVRILRFAAFYNRPAKRA